MHNGITVKLQIKGQDKFIHFSEIGGEEILVKFENQVGIVSKEQIRILKIFQELEDESKTILKNSDRV